MKRTSELSLRDPVRPGFTLVELLVVLLIVSIIAAVTLPVVIPAISHRQVGEAARIIQGGLVAARDASLRTNTPHGIRFLPDPTYNGQASDTTTGNTSTFLSSTSILASNRFIPIEQPPGYSEGRVFIDNKKSTNPNPTINLPQFADPTNQYGYFVSYPRLANNVVGVDTGILYSTRRVLLVVQARIRMPPGTSTGPQPEAPTSWYWNIRAGDKIQINNLGPYFTVVGPVDAVNPEMFVNVDPSTTTLVLPNGTGGTMTAEYLFVVNGEDDDGDGYVDNGWDGLDNNGNGSVDELDEWAEHEEWPAAYVASTSNRVSNTAFDSVSGGMFYGIPYTIVRRPVPSPGARETVLPGSVVVDLTTWDRAVFHNPERSRLPVDRLSGVVDVMVDSGGRMVPTTRYSSPASFGMLDSFYHIWVAERSDLSEPLKDSSGVPQTWLGNPYDTFYLPMPLGRDVGTGSYGPNEYDSLVKINPTLPYLKGQIRILSLSTRTGNMITTDSPSFDVLNVNQPYRAAQLGLQGDTP